MQGPWKEKTEAKLYWRDWEASAVEKFLEWLYTGDYKCPYPVQACKDESLSEDTGEEKDDKLHPDPTPIEVGQLEVPEPTPITCDDSSDGEIIMAKHTRNATFSTRPLTGIHDLTWTGCRTLERLSQAQEFDKWTGHQLWRPDELDYEETFLTHAKLYVMACFYRLDALKNMAWQRLRSVLVSVGKPNPWTPVIDNLATLIHYVYQETGNPETSEEEEPLRMLTSEFAACNFTNLQGDGVNDLMSSTEEGDRDFVIDLMNKVAQEMRYLEGKEGEEAEQTIASPVTKYKDHRERKNLKKRYLYNFHHRLMVNDQ